MKQQRGTAIIVALFMVALVASLSIAMMSRLNRDIRRTELLIQSTQAQLLAQGSLVWAIDSLSMHLKQQQKNALADKLPLSFPAEKVQNFAVSSTIYDGQAYFNVNNLVSEEWTEHFQLLLLAVDPSLGAEKAKILARSVANWIAPASTNLDEDSYYNKLAQPYHAPHRMMASASELRLVKGFTPELYAHLLPFVIALPEATTINVNTAAAPVLQSLSPLMTLESAKAIILIRQSTPFTESNKFSKMDVVINNKIDPNKTCIRSDYFLVETEVKRNKQQLTLYTLMQRIILNNQPAVSILWQSKGGI